MQIFFDDKLAAKYKNVSQKIRVLTENWVEHEIFCPACGNNLGHYENNRPVADFLCINCKEEYELKSKKDAIGNRIVDGAYRTMIERLQCNDNPNLFLLNYSLPNYKVWNFFVIPKHFFIPEIIERRNPLTNSARRAGWIGCNISLQSIPQSGKIFYIKDRRVEPKSRILENWQKTLFLREQREAIGRGWILEIMNSIDRLHKQEFSLDEMYSFESKFKEKYPNNKHIKDKIRQQLQFLRDKGYLKFMTKGRYKLI